MEGRGIDEAMQQAIYLGGCLLAFLAALVLILGGVIVYLLCR
jgi:hypothetical protein